MTSSVSLNGKLLALEMKGVCAFMCALPDSVARTQTTKGNCISCFDGQLKVEDE